MKINKKTTNIIIAFVVIVSIFMLCVQVYVVFKTFGIRTFSQFFPLALSVLMYISIIRYVVDYFVKNKNVSLDTMLIRFVASLVSVISKLDGKNDPTSICIAIVIFLASYLAGSIKFSAVKKNVLLFIAVLILVIIISVMRLMHPNQQILAEVGLFIYVMDSCNIAIEWLLFVVLFFARTHKVITESKE